VAHEEVVHRAPQEILAELQKIERDIQGGLSNLVRMVR
jgi:hypothetical protein